MNFSKQMTIALIADRYLSHLSAINNGQRYQSPAIGCFFKLPDQLEQLISPILA
jgi:hypothetical protein